MKPLNITAQCTLGDGPDILVSIKEKIILLEDAHEFDKFKHGTCSNSQLDLNVKEARMLKAELELAIQHCEEMYQFENQLMTESKNHE